MSYETVDAGYVLAHLDDELIVDVRPEFMYDFAHIPGARSIDYWFLKTQNGFTLGTRLAQQLADMGASPADPVIVYSGDAVMSSEACELLEAQGYVRLRHYVAGWSDWASDTSRPRER